MIESLFIKKTTIVFEKVSAGNVYINLPFIILSCFSVFFALGFIIVLAILFKNKKIFKKEFEKQDRDCLTGAKVYKTFINEISSLEERDVFSAVQINVRNFKYVNEIYGESEGDNILAYLANNIEYCLKDGEAFARGNGDNFIILLRRTEFSDILSFISSVKRKLKDAVGTTSMCDLYAGICMGEDTARELVCKANMALRKASKDKLPYYIYEDSLRTRAENESFIISCMELALQNDEFTFYLQPQHHIRKNNAVLSAESLVRWIRRDGSVVFPSDFIPVFERNGFIVDLDRYLMRKVCSFIKTHINDDWMKNFTVSVNVSRVGLARQDFMNYYINQKNNYNIPDNKIELEFTESAAFDDYEEFKNMIRFLHKAGFSCSLDDFGAGSSSLNVLKELPVNVLKMDRMFFANITDEERNNSVITSVVALAHGLGMKVVAEGIEDKLQIEFLKKIGCDIIQGYVFSCPIPQKEFIEYVKNYTEISPKKNLSNKNLDLCFPEIPIHTLFNAALLNINALMILIDSANDNFKIVSDYSGCYYFPPNDCSFSKTIEIYVNNCVYDDFREQVLNFFKPHNLISLIYGGVLESFIEFRARFYDENLGCLTDHYEWYTASLTVIKEEAQTQKPSKILLVIKNINSMYESELFSRNADMIVDAVFKTTKGIIYNVSVLHDRIKLIYNNSGSSPLFRNGKYHEVIISFAENYIVDVDKSKVFRIISSNFIENFLADTTRIEYNFSVGILSKESEDDNKPKKIKIQLLKKTNPYIQEFYLILF